MARVKLELAPELVYQPREGIGMPNHWVRFWQRFLLGWRWTVS